MSKIIEISKYRQSAKMSIISGNSKRARVAWHHALARRENGRRASANKGVKAHKEYQWRRREWRDGVAIKWRLAVSAIRQRRQRKLGSVSGRRNSGAISNGGGKDIEAK
jgi:hypothetical protein